MQPELGVQRSHTVGQTPASTAAPSLVQTAAIASRRRHSCSRRQTEGRPGERNFLRLQRIDSKAVLLDLNLYSPDVAKTD